MNNDVIKYLDISLPEDILKLKYYGDFKGAVKLIDNILKKEIPICLRKRLELEKEIISELKNQYPFSFDEALKIMQENVKGFKSEELETLKEESAADWILIDGKFHFQNRFFLNLVKTQPNIAERLLKKELADDNSKNTELLNTIIKKMKEKGSLTYFTHIKTGIKIKENSIQEGKTIKIHLPLPAKAKQLTDIEIINTFPNAKLIADENYPQRTAYFEEKVSKNNCTFTVEYSYKNHVEYIEFDENKVLNEQPKFNLDELYPHIVFTPYIKELCKEIIGNEKNPLLKARKIYDFITSKINYTLMREYLTVENIPEYASINLKGDCGVQALLFITLCRCTGIPAKWQSGMYVTPLSIGNHDWAQFYIAPYGWLFADCSFGGSAYRKGLKETWDFYFGNIDPFRMIANSEFQHDFNPNKSFLRIDPYDNQRGEGEYEDKGLKTEDFEIIREMIEIKEI